MNRAREMCPDLVVLPYEFEEYQIISDIIYNIFFSYTHHIQPVRYCVEVHA